MQANPEIVATFGRIWRALARRVAYARFLFFARRDSRRNVRLLSGRNVLVLCYGNIYRSPFVARQLADLVEVSEWQVRSAGFHDKEGRSCDEGFVVLAAERGIELRTHRSRKVTRTDLEWADLIIIMDGRNRLMLREMSTMEDKKVVWIGAWLSGIRPDVVDPYGQTLEKQRAIIERLDQATRSLAESIQSPND